jgi:uncharacterized membrane protein YebE (DUF533 family)
MKLPFLDRLRSARLPPDGAAYAVSQAATGLSDPAVIEAMQQEQQVVERQRRPPIRPRAIVDEALAQKVLHGWLQNRHQTLFPLTINFRTLEPGQARLLTQAMAIALQAVGSLPEGRLGEVGGWLRGVGASKEEQAELHSALMAPPSLATMVRDVQHAGIAAYAYAVCLVAADQRDPAARLFLDYLATRWALPTNLIRSVNRRYRR